MVSSQDRFNKVMLKYGGVLRHNVQSSYAEQLLAGNLASFRKCLQLKSTLGSREECRLFESTYTDYINNWSINALACLENELYMIGIFSGAPWSLFNVSFAMLSHPDIYPELGGTDELIRFDSISSDLSNNGELVFVFRAGRSDYSHPYIPSGSKRGTVAGEISAYAISFIIFHELAHIVKGHLSFIESATGVCEIIEIAGGQSDCLNPIVRQAIEVDADQWAAEQVLKHFVFGEHSLFSSDESRIKAIVFSLGLVLLVFGRRTLDLGDYTRSNHPHPNIRYLWTMGYLTQPLLKITSQNKATILQIISETTNELNTIASILGEGKIAFIPALRAGSKRTIQIMNSLGEQLKKLDPKLRIARKKMLKQFRR